MVVKELISVYDISGHFHTGIVHCVSGCVSVYNSCFQCFCKLYQSACSSSNFLVCTVFRSTSLSPIAISLDTTQCLARVLFKIIVVFL